MKMCEVNVRVRYAYMLTPKGYAVSYRVGVLCILPMREVSYDLKVG